MSKKKTNGSGQKLVPEKCIHPGCRKAHKGPRFHYLCELHRDLTGDKLNEVLVKHYTKVWNENKKAPTKALRKTVLALGIDKPSKGGRKKVESKNERDARIKREKRVLAKAAKNEGGAK